MSALIHTLLLMVTVVGVYVWLHTPGLEQYSSQAFAVSALLYFLVKLVTKAKPWHVLPVAMSLETIIVSFAFLLLIGSTGNTTSVFYPLTYIHLFFIVFSSQLGTTVVMTALIMLFHYSLTPDLSQHALVTLITLPLIMIFFLFAKRQHEEATRDRVIIKKEHRALERLQAEDSTVRMFLHTFMLPKLTQFEELLQYPRENQQPLIGQLQVIKVEIEKVLQMIRKMNQADDQPR